MTGKKFRKIALAMPEAVESSHMDHPDFRVGGKIFATLGPEEDWGMVKLTQQQQAEFMQAAPETFHPANGAWGRNGATIITLSKADEVTVREALHLAWQNVAETKPAPKTQRKKSPRRS